MTLANRISGILETNKISQAALAKRGVSQSYLSEVIGGDKKPSRAWLDKFVRALRDAGAAIKETDELLAPTDYRPKGMDPKWFYCPNRICPKATFEGEGSFTDEWGNTVEREQEFAAFAKFSPTDQNGCNRVFCPACGCKLTEHPLPTCPRCNRMQESVDQQHCTGCGKKLEKPDDFALATADNSDLNPTL